MRATGFLLIALVCLCAAPAAAQDAAGDLASLLAFVPADEALAPGSLISYMDYEAAFAARGGPNPQTAAAFDQIRDTDAWDIWFANAQRLYSGVPAVTQNLLQGYAQSVDVHGFEWFAIDQSLTFGAPPAQGNILAGDFDAEAIRAAFAGRDYTTAEIGGAEALCWVEGCDQGLRVDFAARDPAFLFGGSLGRREPVALLPGRLLNSPDHTTVAAMIAAQAGGSLRDMPVYQALLEALPTLDGDLVQANLLDAGDVTGFTLSEGMGIDPASLGTLPAYALAMLADYQAGDDQIARILLVYDDRTSAEQGAAELGARLASFDVNGIYAATSAQVEAAQVIPAAQGWVAVAGVRYPTPPNQPDDSGRLAASGAVYRVWMQALMRRELAPIIFDAP